MSGTFQRASNLDERLAGTPQRVGAGFDDWRGEGISPRSPNFPVDLGGLGQSGGVQGGSDHDLRASISHAQRVNVAGTAASPPVRRSLLPGSPMAGALPAAQTSTKSPRSSTFSASSPQTERHAHEASAASPRRNEGGFVLTATPPRTSSIRHTSSGQASSPLVAGSGGGTGAVERGAKSSTGSLSRRKPAPLDFSHERSPVASAVEVQQDRGPSSATSASQQDISPRSTPTLPQKQDTSLASSIQFNPMSSPVIDMSIPSPRLGLADDTPEKDDTVASGSSFLSSSTASSTGRRAYVPSRPADLSSSTFSRSRDGLGLGLPFSMSASANLSSLAAAPLSSSVTSTSSSRQAPSITTSNPSFPLTSSGLTAYRSPSIAERSDFSPVVDRGQLVGLGELATPRWTSEALERRWGAAVSPAEEKSADFAFAEQLPMPTIHQGGVLVDSPTVVRPMPRQPLSRSLGSFDSPHRPFPTVHSHALDPPRAFPTSASSASIALDASPAGLLDFTPDPAGHRFGPLDISSAESRSGVHVASPVDAAKEMPRRRTSTRRKSAAPTASTTLESSQPWASSASGLVDGVVGLGFDHEIGSRASGVEEDLAAKARRRQSAGSIASTSSAKRTTRTLSLDGKASAKHSRRQSTGRGSFAHLPPSPAASSASHVFTATPSSDPSIPALPPITTFPASPLLPEGPASAGGASSVSTPSGRTPDHARVSRHSSHSHHSSPSIIAASILRQTRELEGVDVDIEHAAAVDEGTAAALAKLDGVSSPRIARTSGPTAVSDARSRKSSRNTIDGIAASSSNRDSSQSAKRRTRTSTNDSTGTAARDGGRDDGSGSTSRGASRSSSPVGQPVGQELSNSASSASPGRSPLSASTSQFPSSTRSGPASSRLSASTTAADIPFLGADPFKRTLSSSSASATGTGGTSFSASGSLDSTSATSFATRSPASKYQRSSIGSDVSSINSVPENRPGYERRQSNDETARSDNIPPVPPLPKDWETYRPAVANISSPSSQTPHAIDSRTAAPAAASQGLHAPPMSATRTTSSSGGSALDDFATPASPPATSGRRKWSISSAFHKATRSPKTNGVKESTSFSDLQSIAGKRIRKVSLGQGGGTALPRRLAASTSNLSTLADEPAQQDFPSAGTTGSLGRASMRGSQIPPFLRTRTSSQSSSSTNRTAQWAATGVPPSVVATSPGKSRSSIVNPRRTPSGIPFFSRKASSGSGGEVSTTTPSPNLEQSGFSTPATDEKSGRKSILGLNFLRSGGSKRDKDKGLLSPPSANRSTFSASTSVANSAAHQQEIFPTVTDEFGRRASLAAPKSTTSLLRKRGKTISSVDQGDVFRVPESAQLPPLHISALPASTARRVDSMSRSSVPTAPVQKTPRTRTSRLQESAKMNLPTIAGSPSTHVLLGTAASSSSSSVSPSTTPPPKSHTPTRIPRLNRTSAAAATSPRTSPVGRSLSSKLPTRRLSSYGNGSAEAAHQPSQKDRGGLGGAARAAAASSALADKTHSTRRRVESDATQIPRSRSTNSRSSSLKSGTIDAGELSIASETALNASRHARKAPAVDEKHMPIETPRHQPRVTWLSSSLSRLPSQAVTSESSSASSTPAIGTATRRSLPRPGESSAARRTSVPASTDALSSSRSARTLGSKMAVPSRVSKSASTSTRLSPSTTSSGRSSAASGTYGEEDTVRGDEEMAAYVRRQMSKKLASGMSEDAIRKLFEFPDPTEPLPPLSPDDAVSLYSRYLSPYEKDEIREYPRIYFVGPNCEKKQATKEATANNYGFDDDRGDYLLVPHDHIRYRYEVIDVLGKGSFGQVLQCRDHKTGDMVAVKIIRNKKRFHHQALVEIKVLENLVKWDPDEKHYVIRMVDSFTFRGHLCIVTELLSINLYELVKANSFAGFSTTLIRRFTVQILHSLILLRHHRVVHCDLKPENILLRHPAKSGIKVIDFGSSCFENEKVYTYIQSRFYRSPEVILGQNYHMAIDMWSLGCIIAEMYTGYPIFPGENEQEQLACIMEVLGVPDKYLVDRSSRKRLFFDSTGAPRPVVNSKGRRRRPGSKTLAHVLKTDDELFVDFIAKCLAWDPDRRLKPDQAMRHPWIAQSRSGGQSSIPARSSRTSSTLSASTNSRHASLGGPPTIGTPQRLKATQPTSTATAPVPRTRTMSSATATGSVARLGVKSSLPAPTHRHSVKS
ncbi:serine/threonine protein kinase, CMGC, dual-specificity [Rhodotorula toruloides]|uniref:dual-specificity kinase n=2 Tax=Rhodotorula toruloides TaxID=5286 RepID=A0A0K3C8J3_RHOTO